MKSASHNPAKRFHTLQVDLFRRRRIPLKIALAKRSAFCSGGTTQNRTGNCGFAGCSPRRIVEMCARGARFISPCFGGIASAQTARWAVCTSLPCLPLGHGAAELAENCVQVRWLENIKNPDCFRIRDYSDYRLLKRYFKLARQIGICFIEVFANTPYLQGVHHTHISGDYND